MHRERNCVDQLALTKPNVIFLQSTLIIFRITLYVEKQLAIDIMHHMHSTLVPVVDTTPLMMPTSVGYQLPIRIKVSVNTSGAMLQGIVSLVLKTCNCSCAVEQPHHLLALTFTVSLAVMQHQPVADTPPTHSGMVKAATVVASAATPVVHRASSRLHLTLNFAGVSRMELPLTGNVCVLTA